MTQIIAEIGINHNGSLELAKKMVAKAAEIGCDYVKFQKRTPELCVPDWYKKTRKVTPWGEISYIKYREKMEFSASQFIEIADCCDSNQIKWFASCWDVESVKFLEKLLPAYYKIPSPCLTDLKLLDSVKNKKVILSTGMSTWEEVNQAVNILDSEELIIFHCTSSYPCDVTEINLKMIPVLRSIFKLPVGYSNHESGIRSSQIAASLGAEYIECHFTLDKNSWGSDQKASLEPEEMRTLIEEIKFINKALGTGIKIVYESEKVHMPRLRKHILPDINQGDCLSQKTSL